MVNPTDLNNGVVIGWTIPREIQEIDIDRVNIYRSDSENTGYALLDTINFYKVNQYIIEYKDNTGDRGKFYLVTFKNSQTSYESSYQVTYFYPLPKELRLINLVKTSMPDILVSNSTVCPPLTDMDYLAGLNLALQFFNTYPPQTNFTLLNFPKSHEYFLIGFAQLFTLISKFLPVSVRDWSYSEPGGVSMNIDRGGKIKTAIDTINSIFGQYIQIVKLDFSSELPEAIGTLQLPLSFGGVISRSALSILNIFSAAGQ